MKKEIQLKNYIIKSTDEELRVTLKPKSNSQKLSVIILLCFLLIPFLAISILSFVKAMYIYAIMFSIAFAVTMFLAISTTVYDKNKLSRFQFVLNNDGITHSDVDTTYFIPWEEVKTYGFVNFCALTYSRRQPNESQICVYFAKSLFSEQILRKRINKMSIQKHGHCSSNEILVFALREEDKNNLFYDFISKYINANCSKEKEVNYFIESCPW